MPQTLTDKNSLVTQALVDLLKTKWEYIGCQTRDAIYYGDQARYPSFPSLAVEAAPQDRQLNQTGLQQRIGFTMFIMVYHGLLKGAEERKKDTDEIAERVVETLHDDRQLDGLVIHGHVTGVEPGFINRGGLLMVHRITWEGISNHVIPRS